MDDRSFLDIKLEQLSRQYVTTYVKGQLTDSLFVRLQKEFGGEFFEHNPAIQTFSKLLSMNKNVEISMPYINLKMQTPSGSPVTLSDYIQKGKYVLIDFWASWCAP